MKIYDVFEKSAHLVGIGDDILRENGLDYINDRALTAINTVLFDLCGREEAKDLFEEINIPASAADTAVYGVAMFLCVAFGDTEKANFFSGAYNDKRAKLKSQICTVSDVLPKSGEAL